MAQKVSSVAILIATLMACQQVATASGFYDPEQQDGIPVFSARSIVAPGGGNDDTDHWPAAGSETSAGSDQARRPQRRQDPDLDEALEDDDDDEAYRSGSVNRESIENPSYGESRRAERDGDEIENFFDRHLGPPQNEAASAAAPGDETRQMAQHVEVPARDPDDTDGDYAAAASGPIASFLHNLIFHHADADKESSHSSSASTGAEKTASRRPPFVIHAFGASPSKGSEKDQEAKESPEKETEKANNATPLVAAPSSIIAYEPSAAGEPASAQEVAPPQAAAEFYIGRRPTVMSYLQQAQQQAAASDEQLPQQAIHYQQVPAGSTNIWRTPHTGYQHQQVVMPVAYASYRQQQLYPTDAMGPSRDVGGEQDNEEQTVTYGLSFGSKPQMAAVDEGTSGGGGDDEEQQVAAAGGVNQEQPQMTQQMLRAQQQLYQQQQALASGGGYVPYSARYRPAPTDTRQLQQYGSGAAYSQSQLSPAQREHLLSKQNYRQQLHYGQRDANAEALARAAAQLHAAQAFASSQDDDSPRYSAQQQQQQQQSSKKNQILALERQKLLARLSKEIQSSPVYQQQQNQAASLQWPRLAAGSIAISGSDAGRRPLTAFQSVHRSYLGDNLDSFKSFHAETDPYKSLTTFARMVPDSSLQQAAQDEQDKANGSEKRREQTPIARPSGEPAAPTTDELQDRANLLTGPLTKTSFDATSSTGGIDLLRTNNQAAAAKQMQEQPQSDNKEDQQASNHLRVRRDDSEDRDDADDDGVWVDDDDDDENRQQSSDVNETAQDPEDQEDGDSEGDAQQDGAGNAQVTSQLNPPGVIGGPHGYELSPNDLMIYNG